MGEEILKRQKEWGKSQLINQPYKITMPIVFILIFFFLMLAVVVLYSWWMMDALFGDEDFETSKEAVEQIGKIIAAYKRQNGLLYDLGSCRGGFVFKILKTCPALQVVGIDNSRLRTWFAKMRSLFYKNKNSPRFLKADIFDIDISRVDSAFIYLPRPLLPALEAKLQKELKPGSLVITYRINLPNWRPSQVFLTDLQRQDRNNIFVYHKI